MSGPMIIFLVIATGYLTGAIKVRGFSLGSSGVLLAALLFGHLGYRIPEEIKETGLVMFVASVGIIAGNGFFRNIKKSSLSYLIIGFVTILIGALVCMAVIIWFDVPTPLAAGIMTGALTSTPGLAAAVEAAGDPAASVGYGIAYPFGVIGVVIFVQLMQRFTGEKKKEDNLNMEGIQDSVLKHCGKRIEIEKNGIFALALAITTGIVIGGISLPLPGDGSFSLGNSGGPLLTGLLAGHFGHIWKIDMSYEKKTMELIRELGMILFLTGAGLDAGNGFSEIIRENGIRLLLFGALITLIPMLISYIMARKLLRMNISSSLGAICGGMTSTPALGVLLNDSENGETVTEAYAMTYPVALICVILWCQIIAFLF